MFKMKLTFMIINISSTITMMTMNNWLTIWMNMEMTMFSFMPIMNNNLFYDSMIKYFLMQVYSSSFMMMSILTTFMPIMTNKTNKMMMTYSILMKMAFTPFHLWMIMISEMINWLPLMLTLTIHKYPLFITMLYNNNKTMMPMMMMSIITSTTMNFNMNSINKMIIYSSIMNNSIMMIMITMNMNNWMNYMTMYCITITMTLKIMKNKKILKIYQMKNYINMNMKMNTTIMMMTFMNLPPFNLYLMKWMMIMTTKYISTIMIIMMMNSTLMTYMYMKMMMMTMFKYSFTKKTIMKNTKSNMYILNISMIIIIMMM